MERRIADTGAHRHLTDADMAIVQGIHLFDGLDRQLVGRLVDDATTLEVDAPTLLFSAGDPAAWFYVVATGRVRLFALTLQGRHTTISFVEAGFSFAEAAIFGMRFYPVNAEATSGTRLIQIPAERFVAQIGNDPELPMKMLAALARWQSRLSQSVAELKICSPSQRFAAVLLSLTDRLNGPAEISLPVSKAALANRIGIAPESLSRVIARMQDLGVVVDGPLVRVTEISALRQHCLDAGEPTPA